MKRILMMLIAGFLFGALPGPARAAGQLVIFMWPEYIDPAIVEEFEQKYDLKVSFDYYESNEEMASKLQAGGLGKYDIVMPATYIVPSLVNLNLIQPLDPDLIPNIKNLSSEFTRMEVDPGNQYTLPYTWGISGLAVRSGNISAVEATWGLIFDPKQELGTFVVLDNARDALGAALKYLGYSLNSTDPAQIKQAADLLIELKKRPTFLGFYGGVGALEKLMSRTAVITQAYNGETGRIGREGEGDIHFVLPREGGEIWTDLVAIPARAPNLEEAHQFINFLLEPEVAARNAGYNQCATPNEAAKQFIPPEDLGNPVMYPSEKVIENLEYIKDIGPANRLYDEAWTMIKTR